MKRALLTVFILLFSVTAHAEDSLVLWGNYYKERSTRVIEPTLALTKDLPGDVTIEVGYLVDQVTSASGAVTGGVDGAFSELRHDVRAAGHMKMLGWLTPGVRVRFSREPDYSSLTVGADLSLSLDRDNTVISAFAQYQNDDARMRVVSTMGLDDSFVRIGGLETGAFGVTLAQVITKNFLAGGSVEMQFLDGFQENVYRVETHPTGRIRRAFGGWGAYHIDASDTTLRAAYRLYHDNWHLVGHTFEVEGTQRVSAPFELYLRLRYYTQNDVYFVQPINNFSTADPKLIAFNSGFYELGFRLTMTVLEGTFLETFARSRIEPSYALLEQGNRYGTAHLVQLGWFWPF